MKLEVGDDWCVGGCPSWRDTEKGRALYEELKAKHAAATEPVARRADAEIQS